MRSLLTKQATISSSVRTLLQGVVSGISPNSIIQGKTSLRHAYSPFHMAQTNSENFGLYAGSIKFNIQNKE
jgi:hypothetical protein